MDQCLAGFADKLGYNYTRGILLTHCSHVQLQFIACASAKPGWTDLIKRRAPRFKEFIATLLRTPLAIHKTAAIVLMSTFILVSPQSLAQRLCVMSYRMGMVLSSNKIVQNQGV